MMIQENNFGEASATAMPTEHHDTMTASEVESKGKSQLVLILFYALGTISLVPQNFYITANDYWMYSFRDLNGTVNSSADKTELQKNFTAYYSTASSVCFITFILLTTALIKKIGTQMRIVASIVVMLSLFLLTLIFIWIDTDSWQHGFFVLSLVIGALITACGGCFLITAFQLSSNFPIEYLGAQLSGQSICGIFAALSQVFTLLLGVSSKVSAMIYFLICTCLIVITMVFYLFISHKNEYFLNHLETAEKKKEEKEKEEKEERKALLKKIDFNKLKRVAGKIIILMITMAITAGSAIIIHPGITALVESTGKGTSRWSDVFFVPVCTFLLYNVCDFIGREVSLRWLRVKNLYIILAAGILRLIFIPIIMFCNAQPRDHLPVAFHGDYLYIIFLIVFAFSNGYLMNLCLMEIPSVVEKDETDIAQVLIVLIMMASMGIFSALSSVVVHLL